MRNFALSLLVIIGFVIAESRVQADGLSPADQAFLDKHMADVVKVTPRHVENAAVVKTFKAPIYELEITINQGDNGSSSQKQLAARVDDKLMALSRPGSTGDCPWLAAMIRPDFTLHGDADAKTMQDAFDLVFAPFTDDDKKNVAFRHKGHEWTFIRGKFFDKKLGFILTTDDQGKVISAKFSLEIPS